MSDAASLINNQKSTQPVIVHVINGLRFGGNETLCLQLLRHAPSHVQNVLLNVDSQYQEMLSLFQAVPGLTIHHQTTLLYPRIQFIWALYTCFKQWHPQAVLVYPFGLHVFVALAARLAGVPVVAVHAGNPPPELGHSDRWKWKLLITLSWLLRVPIYSCSHAAHQMFTELMPLPKGSFPIPNGCNIEDIAQRAEQIRKGRASSTTTIIGMVARLNTIKDQATVIRAFGRLIQTCKNIELWLVGDGSEREALEALCNSLDLTNHVKFWGARSDVPELLGHMDIYAFSTTRDEGFGIALVEAMAASLPVVASRVAACQEVLNQGEAGILVPPQDADAMAKAFETLIRFPKEQKTWGRRAYNRAVKHYTIQTCAQQWYNLLLNHNVE
ncbi:glycosyltransferase [Oscillatoria sp. FACHB-1407]|uniref:glycosyltransferase n=1 Tax=Oscillatoria sp. FACHB-1407 TaxID=2692847 RepID=UPI001686A668|nr:glycosyltransferase [Oscillatoria sp. FACHB-1407]MBD2459664.1 glycosyltransferase [Oscillatoria sp. FACHB-1407]